MTGFLILGSIMVGALLAQMVYFFLGQKQRGLSLKNLISQHEKKIMQLRNRIEAKKKKRKSYIERRHKKIKDRLAYDREKWADRSRQFKSKRTEVDRQHQEIDKRSKLVRDGQRDTKKKRQEIIQISEEVESLYNEQRQRIEGQLGLKQDVLLKEYLESFTNEIKHERQQWSRNFVEEVDSTKNELAEDYVDLLINRLQLKPTVKQQESTFHLKEKTFAHKTFQPQSKVVEKIKELCQVDFVFDEQGHRLSVSSFDGVARERAIRLVDQVIRHRKDDLGWIEKQYEQSSKRLDREMTRGAGDLLRRLKIENVSIEIVRLQGRIRFRTSFGQNVLDHQLEVGFLCGMLAQELGGFDFKTLRQCGFFHDIGKAIDVVQEGSHPQLGGDFLQKYNAPEIVVHAAYKHHDPFDREHLQTAMTTACDAMSASRPGARRESIDSYVERVESLEKIACEPVGVTAVAVMHAGRKIQVNVNSEKIEDQELEKIGDLIAQNIEQELVYPGEICVNVVRETNVRVVAH